MEGRCCKQARRLASRAHNTADSAGSRLGHASIHTHYILLCTLTRMPHSHMHVQLPKLRFEPTSAASELGKFFVYPTLPVFFSVETLKAFGPFYLVPMPCEVKISHAGGKYVTCRGLHILERNLAHSELNLSLWSENWPRAVSEEKKLEKTMEKACLHSLHETFP